jgi:hypothetical protein
MFLERLKLHFAMNIYVIHNFSLPGTWVPQLWQNLALFSANLVPHQTAFQVLPAGDLRRDRTSDYSTPYVIGGEKLTFFAPAEQRQ